MRNIVNKLQEIVESTTHTITSKRYGKNEIEEIGMIEFLHTNHTIAIGTIILTDTIIVLEKSINRVTAIVGNKAIATYNPREQKWTSIEPSTKAEIKLENLNIENASIEIGQLFTETEANEIFEKLEKEIKWEQKTIKMYGKENNIPRLTAWYGTANYSYSGIENNCKKLTETLKQIKNKIEKLLGCNIEFNSVLANLYRNGKDSVSWHSDDEKELGINPVIASVSLGVSRIFQLKNKQTKQITSVELNNGSILVMSGTTQNNYLHQIPKTKKEIGQRINLTFRIMK